MLYIICINTSLSQYASTVYQSMSLAKGRCLDPLKVLSSFFFSAATWACDMHRFQTSMDNPWG